MNILRTAALAADHASYRYTATFKPKDAPKTPQLAAIMRSQINVQELTVLAALTGKREHVYHAAMMDPHTAAELSLDEIRALCDALIAAHGNYLPAYH